MTAANEGFKVRMKFVDSFKDRHGHWRYYFRRRNLGGMAVALPHPVDPVEPCEAFMTAYAACLEGKTQIVRPGTTGGVIYAVAAGRYVKIGYTTDLGRRLKTLNTGSPVPLKVVKRIRGTPTTERELHARFRPWKQRNEWFVMEGDVEKWVKG